MLEKLKAKVTQARAWILRKRAVRDLIKQNRYAIEVERIMEQFATNRILSGESPDARNQSRNVLVKHQQTIRVKSDFQDFLESL
jgi:hypothetical protein